jgi:hypothetical protein
VLPNSSRSLPLDQFGAGLLRAAVTPERVAEIVRRILGGEFEVGPLDVGPAGIASASARARLGTIRAGSVEGDPSAMRVRIPVALSVRVRLGASSTRFLAHATVELALHVDTCPPLGIAVTVHDPSDQEVALRLMVSTAGRRFLLGLGGVDGTLRRHVREFVRDAVTSPEARRYLHIDLVEVIERAWQQDLLTSPGPVEGAPDAA